jgi:hypothetical protein
MDGLVTTYPLYFIDRFSPESHKFQEFGNVDINWNPISEILDDIVARC